MSDTVQARRASGLSITPFAAIALGFFLPTLRACGVMQRPITYLPSHPHTAPWLVAPYVSALAFAIVTAVLFVRDQTPSTRAFRVAWIALGCSFVGTAATLVGWLTEQHANTTLITWSTAMICVALVAVQRAIRFDGWSRWIRFVLVQAALTAGNTVWMMIVTAMGDGAWDAIGPGGHLFVWGTVLCGLVAVYGIRGNKPQAQSS
jgi:hypothetical protein